MVILIKEDLRTKDGEIVPSGKHSLTSIIIETEGGKEQEILIFDDLGFCVDPLSIKVLSSFGKINIIQN